MKGDEILKSDHLALHCQPTTGIEVDGQGLPVGINRDAFRVDEDGISSNWVEFNGGDLNAACMLLASVRTARKSHRVAKFNVGAAVDLAYDLKRLVKAIHDPIDQPPNPGHALLTGVKPTDEELLDHLAMISDISAFPDAAIQLAKARR